MNTAMKFRTGSIKGGVFIDKLGHYLPVKKGSAPRSYVTARPRLLVQAEVTYCVRRDTLDKAVCFCNAALTVACYQTGRATLELRL
jgi:hypothetical protein